jgi:hypothetical protein
LEGDIMKTTKIEIEISSDGNVFLKHNNIEEDYGTSLSEPISPDRVGLIVQRFIEEYNLMPTEVGNFKIVSGHRRILAMKTVDSIPEN